jgi:predicted RNA-binding protein with PUA-like domain
MDMPYWLLKTEPSEYSYADLEREKQTVWSGVNNNLALQHLRRMRTGDLAIIYHTGNEKAAVGVAELGSEPYPDRKLKDPKRVVVDIKSRHRLNRIVPLSEIKSHPKLKVFELVRNSRLSVMPVSEEIWKILMEMSKE